MDKRWRYIEEPSKDLVEGLSKTINVNKNLASILIQRDIKDFNSAKTFFRPSLDHLHDPFIMKDMGKAIERLSSAYENKEKILIYGDYDVDGTTSVALLVRCLREHFAFLNFYINDRESEGYGISEEGIEFALNQGIDLIISIDCGIKADKQVLLAREKGMDFIICDHHNPGEEMPLATAILDPKRKDCPYPFKDLSGCGIGFKLLQAFYSKMNFNTEIVYENMDLVAVSIAADIVPITQENRTLCYLGLEVLRKNPSAGLKALRNVTQKNNVDISTIVFGIAPRINAAGRMSHANKAVKLLLASTDEEASGYLKIIEDFNTIRKNSDMEITGEALNMIKDEQYESKTTVLFKEGWHKGIVGIVASRCIENYYRPTIILAEKEGILTGSARSVEGFDIYEAILSCSEWLDKFGGHTYAAGMSLKKSNFHPFKEAFEKKVSETISNDSLIPSIVIDKVISFEDINDNFIKILNQMSPFGPGNLKPVFESKEVTLASNLHVLKEKHLKFKVSQKGSNKQFDAIGFNLDYLAEKIKKSNSLRIAYSLEFNDFYGTPEIQMNLRDIKFD